MLEQAHTRERSPRVLVVDDDPGVARILALTFEEAGAEVHVARDGQAALDLVAEVAPDVLVLDLQMPRLDGRSCFRRLRAQGVHTPVMLLSAHGARAAKAELGAEDALEKPFDPEALVRRTFRLLQRA